MSAAPHLRGWCPGVVRPMPTGDGLLVRVHPQAGRLTASQLRAVAEAARRCGNGTIEVSSRANLQIRGVSEETHPTLVRILDAAGLAEAPGGGPYRPCVVSPLAGIEPDERFDSFALACQIDDALGADSGLRALPAKFGIVVDGGGRFPLDEVPADISIAPGADGKVVVGTADAGAIRWFGPVAIEEAAAVVHRIASELASSLAESGARPVPPASPRPEGPRVGAVALGDRAAVLLGLAFGRCDAEKLESVAELAVAFGAGEIRTAPWRALAIPGVHAKNVERVLAAAEQAGFVVRPEDPRLAISACPGRPACASAEASTLNDAKRLAPLVEHLPAGSTVHVSGCAKGCARRGAADLTLVGDGGGYRIVLGGTARDAGMGPFRMDKIVDRLAAGELLAEETA